MKKLPNITRPRVRAKSISGLYRNFFMLRLRFPLCISIYFGEETTNEEIDIFPSVPQRWQVNDADSYTMEKVFTKTPISNILSEIAMGCSENAHIRFNRFGFTNGSYFLLL